MDRDMMGYGPERPNFQWPNKSKVAINFVINYEEGAENSPINGDDYCESYGGELPMPAREKHQRNLSMESLFEYGSRVGIWRLLRLFDRHQLPVTFFATGKALSLNPALCQYLKNHQHDIAGHGWRWIDYQNIDKKIEKTHITQCKQTIEALTGKCVEGWYTGRRSENTRALLQEVGGFQYDSDAYADELPYFIGEQLIIPYTLVYNDFRFLTTPGFASSKDFQQTLTSAVDYLLKEDKMSLLTIGLHPRITGYAHRCQALAQFVNRVVKQDVWIARRIDIASYWLSQAT